MPQRATKGRIELKPTQERVLAALAEDGSVGLTRGRYEDLAGVSRSQAAYDLAELVEAGILERVGGGRATTYRFVRRARPAGQRHWTNERIHAALVDFCAGRKTWPSASEFKADGAVRPVRRRQPLRRHRPLGGRARLRAAVARDHARACD